MESYDRNERVSYLEDRGRAGVLDLITQLHALRALAHEPRFDTSQPGPLRSDEDYETETPFARIRVVAGVDVGDAQSLFAALAEHGVSALAKLGKINLVVGAPASTGQRDFVQANLETKTLSFLRDDGGRLPFITQGEQAGRIVEALAMLRVDSTSH